MFLDEATIQLEAGPGGRGCVSWRREKYVAKGGPDGGNGGRGGDIYFVASNNADTLSDYASCKSFKAEKGAQGRGQNCNGKGGEDLELMVPTGTLIIEDGNVLADLSHHGDRWLAAKGGRGGYGNAHFKSSTRQRPDFAELGEPGQKRTVTLELKLVADVGIIGFPSVGKSTLISVVSNAKPKIAEYEFTTIIPNLGVVNVNDRSFVICDVPGLIEGAADGKGLGHEFLKHIERCGVLLHLLDPHRAMVDGNCNVEQLVEDYRTIRQELERYSPTLAQKREVVALNKVDLVPDQQEQIIAQLKEANIDVALGISAATTLNTAELMQSLWPIIVEERAQRQEAEEDVKDEIPVLKPQELSERMGAYRLERISENEVQIYGKRLEQLVIMTDINSPGALKRFRDVVQRIGLKKDLQKLKLEEDAIVRIGEAQVQEYL